LARPAGAKLNAVKGKAGVSELTALSKNAKNYSLRIGAGKYEKHESGGTGVLHEENYCNKQIAIVRR
jgi:hypothetical protein